VVNEDEDKSDPKSARTRDVQRGTIGAATDKLSRNAVGHGILSTASGQVGGAEHFRDGGDPTVTGRV